MRSSRNARRHGLFATELKLSEKDLTIFNNFRADLQDELKPNSPLFFLLFDNLVACAWRVKQALRCEQMELAKQFEERVANDERSLSPTELPLRHPFPLTVWQIQKRIKLLGNLRTVLEERGYLPDKLDGEITQAFGAEFCRALRDWKPMDKVKIQVANMTEVAVERAELFRTELPVEAPSPKEKSKYLEASAFKEQELIGKILDLQKQQLLNALYNIELEDRESTSGKASRLELFLRYQTSTRREFYRALQEYLNVKTPSSSA